MALNVFELSVGTSLKPTGMPPLIKMVTAQARVRWPNRHRSVPRGIRKAPSFKKWQKINSISSASKFAKLLVHKSIFRDESCEATLLDCH